MDDEQVWLKQAEYQDAPVHRLRKAPIAAAIAAAATLALIMAMPRSWVERAVYELYVDWLIPAARLPLGDMAHAVVAFVAAAVVAALAFSVARFVDFGRLLSRRDGAPSEYENDAGEPRLRRADSHPDAPPRAPFRFDPDFAADEDDHENYAAESADDPAAMAQDDADDALFDLGGFEAADQPTVGLGDPAKLDVAAIDANAYSRVVVGQEPGEDETVEPLFARDVEDDLSIDVRAKFADMFDPDDDSGDDNGAAPSDLSHLTTGDLIDELERRMAARQGETERDSHATAERIAQPPAPAPAPAPAAQPQCQPETAANDQIKDGPVADDASNDEDSSSDFDEMDAALKAALGTLARMQRRSAG